MVLEKFDMFLLYVPQPSSQLNYIPVLKHGYRFPRLSLVGPLVGLAEPPRLQDSDRQPKHLFDNLAEK